MYCKTTVLISALLLGLSFNSSAMVVFEDDFNSETTMGFVEDYTGFSNWSLQNKPDGASVDLLQGGELGVPAIGHGHFVDLDGGISGTLVTKQKFTLELNKTYRLSYDLAGNNRNSEEDWVRASLGNSGGRTLLDHVLAGTEGFMTYSFLIEGNGDSDNTLAFRTNGNADLYPNQSDGIGLLLDNIKLELVDVAEPSPLALMGLGLLGLIFIRRRSAK